ncbi:MAG: DUF2185 domain-containing protein [Myxococcota bacterium]
MSKRIKLAPHEIQAVAPGHGSCSATDKIVVGGEKVGFMYREAPANAEDSGWRFLSGSESEDYMNDPKNHGVYDVNLIANCDRDIVPHLSAPIGSAFERAGEGFVETFADLP